MFLNLGLRNKQALSLSNVQSLNLPCQCSSILTTGLGSTTVDDSKGITACEIHPCYKPIPQLQFPNNC